MTTAGFLTYALALAVAAAIPGPGVIALVARALGSGFRPTFPMLLGLALGDVIYLTAAVLGLAYIASAFGMVFVAIKYLGAAYLVWLAVSFWRTGVTAETVGARKATGGLASFSAGLLVTLSNPKTMVFYLALLPTLLDLSAVTVGDMALLVALTFLVLLAVLAPYVAMAGRARRLLQSPRSLRALNRFAATCLAGAAAVIVARSG
ncbi:LysE family translocator [Oricola cellulosilytica]|uniref:LysE family translocator n=1 Tax=Oricola cellulosilytica TaxID=1429082 RepID=A0A4R0PKF2_9HYPH|nr:LysE family translocator [Oricola cellulosilytica]TCD16069.1 LysE family translocator [Oricola cellulosilytica]